jgi:DNA polymerase-3 subunit delta'
MKTISELISNKNSYKHHAILLISNYFSNSSLPEESFKSILLEFCGIKIFENSEEDIYKIATRHPDIFIADRDRKSLRIEDIKSIREFTLYPPQQGFKRLFLIENCERLNANAANSLLKVLEEPSTECLFLLTCAKISVVLPTISSRVQKIPIYFPNIETFNPQKNFSIEELHWFKNTIDKFKLENYTPLNSLSAINKNKIESRVIQCGELISQCEKIAKEHDANEIRDVLVSLINEKLRSDKNFINIAKLFLTHISQWKNFENYHLSTSLWLIRSFLLFL